VPVLLHSQSEFFDSAMLWAGLTELRDERQQIGQTGATVAVDVTAIRGAVATQELGQVGQTDRPVVVQIATTEVRIAGHDDCAVELSVSEKSASRGELQRDDGIGFQVVGSAKHAV